MVSDVAWLEGESGALLTFTRPFPPGVQDRVDKGILREVPQPEGWDSTPRAPEPPSEPREPAGDAMPRATAPKPVWVAYAVRQGMSRERAQAMTTAKLRAAVSR